MSERQIKEFAARHTGAGGALRAWTTSVKLSEWNNPAELRRTFGSADFVGDKTIFNIGGNKYRLIAYVHYRKRIVFVKHVLTHVEYDKGEWK